MSANQFLQVPSPLWTLPGSGHRGFDDPKASIDFGATSFAGLLQSGSLYIDGLDGRAQWQWDHDQAKTFSLRNSTPLLLSPSTQPEACNPIHAHSRLALPSLPPPTPLQAICCWTVLGPHERKQNFPALFTFESVPTLLAKINYLTRPNDNLSPSSLLRLSWRENHAAWPIPARVVPRRGYTRESC
jgi:hypothetical protein